MEKARLIAVASEHSSDWMNALPIKGSELKLDDTSLRIAVGLRLGLQIVTPHNSNTRLEPKVIGVCYYYE